MVGTESRIAIENKLTQGDSYVISFHIYANWVSAVILWVKLLQMFVTLMSFIYALSAG